MRRRDVLLIAVAGAVAATAATVAGGGQADPDHYIVEAGNTWQSLASAAGVPVLDLQRANCPGVQSSTLPSSCTGTLRVGRILHIPEVTPSTSSTSTSSSTSSTSSTTTSPTTTSTSAPTTTDAPTTTAAATTTTAATTSTTAPLPAGVVRYEFRTAAEFYEQFQTQVFHRNGDFQTGVTWAGDHNLACQNPYTERTVHGEIDAELFWWCAPNGADTGHVMTSMGNMSAYNSVSFAPNRTFANVTRVCWDMNLTRMDRQWAEVLILPEVTYQANGGELRYVSPAVDEPSFLDIPSNAVLWQREIQGYPTLYVGQNLVHRDPIGLEVDDRARRFKHCMVDNGNNTITIEQEQVDGQMMRGSAPGSFPDGPVRILVKSHSYDPGKGGRAANHTTWHYDNLEITSGGGS
jgi:LysM repeat protein